jgi:hypothetical protein
MAALLIGCHAPYDAATALKESVESIGNEMMALHEPSRAVEYHDRSGQPFSVAFIPPGTDAAALTRLGIAPGQQCPTSELPTVGIESAGQSRCVTLARLVVPALRVVHKDGHTTVRMILDLDMNGYRLVEVQ